MAAGPVFPAFLKLEALDPGDAFRAIEAGAKSGMGRARQAIEADGAAIQRALQKAFNVSTGTLDLGGAQYQEAARRAQEHASSLRLVNSAAIAAAAATGDSSRATQQYLAVTGAAATQAEVLARAAGDEAAVMARLQAELAALPSAHRAAQQAAAAQANALSAVGKSAAANRFAVQNLGFQVQDFAVQVVSGQSALVAFAQQLPQAAGAVSGMGGRLAAVGAFLGGGWGIALVTATAVVGPLVAKLLDLGSAADTAKLASSGLSEAQSALGEVFDLTSGKLQKQNELLLLNARLQAVNLRAEAAKARTSAAGVFGRGNDVGLGDRYVAAISGEGGGTGTVTGTLSSELGAVNDNLGRLIELQRTGGSVGGSGTGSGFANNRQNF